MDPLQNDIWAHLGHVTEGIGDAAAAPAATQPVAPLPAGPGNAAGGAAGDPADQRHSSSTRRRFDRGGRRREDWPEDAGLSCCPGCGFEKIQSLGVLDSGDYLWQCPQCDRRFQTGRATRTML